MLIFDTFVEGISVITTKDLFHCIGLVILFIAIGIACMAVISHDNPEDRTEHPVKTIVCVVLAVACVTMILFIILSIPRNTVWIGAPLTETERRSVDQAIESNESAYLREIMEGIIPEKKTDTEPEYFHNPIYLITPSPKPTEAPTPTLAPRTP